jgi:hypothetical protein
MFYKQLVSFVAGLAALSSVAAAGPVPAGSGSAGASQNPPSLTPIPAKQCTETLLCCATLKSPSDSDLISAAKEKGVTLESGLDAGTSCYIIPVGGSW